MATGYLNIAESDDCLAATPTWTRLDSAYKVTGMNVDRGRSFELDVTDTGTATAVIVDEDGSLDPTNTGGTYFGIIKPYLPVLFQLPDASGTWKPIFTGYVETALYEWDVSGNFATLTLECVDLLDLLAGLELTGDGSWGNSVTSAGDIVFNLDTNLDAVRTRIIKVLDQAAVVFGGASFPPGRRSIFSGNVGLQQSTYTTRTSALSVIRDAADAEFPNVSNFFVDRNGVVCFRGRYARFDYENTDYNVGIWALGDKVAADASPTTVVPISPGFAASYDKANVYATCCAMAAASNLTAADFATNTVAGATIGRTWAAEDLQTNNGEGPTTAQGETYLFSYYMAENYNQPRLRCSPVTIRGQYINGTYGDATWDFITSVELNDYTTLTTSLGAGGFTGDGFFVEGVSYEILPGNEQADVTLTVDISPQGYFSFNPFAGP